MFIRSFCSKKGKTLSVTTTAAQETVAKNGEYAVSNEDAALIVYVNTDGVAAVATTDMPVFPQETKVFRCPIGTLDYIGSGELSVKLNQVISNGMG